MVRETRHLWVGNLPENIREEDIVKHFTRYGRVESVKILPKRSSEGGRASFVDFVDIRSATKAHESVNRIGDREMRTDYNEPSSNQTTISSRVHDPSAPRPVSGPPPSPPRGRRYERRGEGMQEGRYSSRSSYQYEGYSDEESNTRSERSRYQGQKGYSRSDVSGAPKRAGAKPETYHSRGPSPDNSSDSESDSSDSHSGTQSDSSSSVSSSEDESEVESRSASPGSETSRNHKTSSSLCVKNLSTRSSDGSIREGLYHEFKKHGEVTRIYVQGTGSSRLAIIYFRRPEESERAMEACQGKMFLGAEMQIQPWSGHPEKSGDRGDSSDYPPRYRSNGSSQQYPDDDFDPGCTRTLFVGNIEKSTTYGNLKEAFERYGEVIDVDIKKQPGNNPYAFVQFADLSSAIQARRRMDREFIGRNRVKVGFGKVAPMNTIWVGGVTMSLSEQQLDRHFSRYGRVTRVVINRMSSQALISFDSIESASIAQMKGRNLFGRRVRVEMVSRDSRQLFYDNLQRVGQTESTSSSRRYDMSPPDRSRGRGSGTGYNDYRRGNRGGMRGGMRRDSRGYRPWHHQRMDYDNYSSEGGGGGWYHQDQHQRNRGPYEGGREYENDDYDQELKEYNSRRQREREREREKEDRRDRPPRERHEGDYSDSEQYYPSRHSRWPADENSSGSYEEEPREHRRRRQDYADKRDRNNYSEEREGASSPENKSEVNERDERLHRKSREKKKRRLQHSEEREEEEEEEEESIKKRKRSKGEGEGRIEGEEHRKEYSSHHVEHEEKEPRERSKERGRTKVEEEPAPPPPDEAPPEKKKKEKKEKKEKEKKKKQKRVRTPPPPPDETKSREKDEVDTTAERLEVREDKSEVRDEEYSKAPVKTEQVESSRFENNKEGSSDNEEKPASENSKTRRRISREEREREREPARSPKKVYREEKRRELSDVENGKPKRRRQSIEESPPPPPPLPPPPPPPEEAAPLENPPITCPPFDVGPSPVRNDVPYDMSPLSRTPIATSPVVGVLPGKIPHTPGITSTPPIATASPLPPTEGHPGPHIVPSPQTAPSHQPYNQATPSSTQPANADTLLELLCRYPVVWQGLVALKNDTAAVQMHYLSGNSRLAEVSLPQAPMSGVGAVPPPLRIAQRMRLEASQLEGVVRRMQSKNDHCLLLALPCGRDPLDVHAQTRALKNGFITYLQQKQAAGIINVARPGSAQPSYVLHIFPPCDFAQEHLARVSPDLLDSAADSGHLMVVVASV